MLPGFKFEKVAWQRGFKVVAGTDEVGRGAWAGPVVVAAVVWPPLKIKNQILKIKNSGIKINDSKKLTPREREQAGKWIKVNAFAWGIGESSVETINKLGLKKATEMAFRRAIAACGKNLEYKIQFLLVDAFYLPYVKGLRRKNQKAIIKGDEKSFSIAAASIVAKVYRDKLMVELARRHKVYGWARNKGYGTHDHQEAVKRYGITSLHRKQFVRKII